MAVVISIAPYQFLPARIGGQKNIALFYKYFSRYQKLICVTVGSNQNNLAEGYEVLSLFSNSKLRYVNPFHFFRLRKLINERKATHLLIEHPYFGWLAFLLKSFTGVKLVIHSHNIEGNRFKTLGKSWWKLLWLYEKWIHRQADYNLFITAEDQAYAVQHFGLQKEKCTVVTYGIEWAAAPSAYETEKARTFLRTTYNIPAENKILLFAGSFNYAPNLDALNVIQNSICPLLQGVNFPYTLFICGPHLPPGAITDTNTIATGFVDDIGTYFKAADVFLNPVIEGGGIKTKLVEALGNNANAVSTVEGAIGVDPQLTNDKLTIIQNGDWNAFAAAVVTASTNKKEISPLFYNHFYWGYSTKKAAEFIEQ
jgi:polysaccharide biosynthesis protein PslH